MMRFEIECSGPCLDFCVCDYHTSQKIGKENIHSCKEPRKISEVSKKAYSQ